MEKLIKVSLFLLLVSAYSVWAQTINYKYDALGRVTYVNDTVNGNRDYDYDKAGNRLFVATGATSDAAAEPTPAPLLPAPTGQNCYPIAQGAWKAVWNTVPGADHYVFRLGDNYLTAYTPNEPNYAVRITGTSSQISTPVYSINTTTMPCKWVQACDASNRCSNQTYF